MLPERSKRYAGIDGEIPRLILASNWQLALVALLVLALLFLIFPRQTLVQKLYEQESLDELTQSYIQNLYRADRKNADIGILLTRAQQDSLDIKTLEDRLLASVDADDTRQRTNSRIMLARAYEKALTGNPGEPERQRLTAQLTAILEKVSVEPISASMSRFFAGAAFDLRLPHLGLVFLAQVGDEEPIKTLEQYGKKWLGQGDYEVAAQYFLMARDQTADPDEARRLFQRGIGSLMAASRFKQAMQASDTHLGNLSGDAATLRYLVRTAQAAGEPVRAADYAHRLVFQASRSKRQP
ncbi:MAG: hypothetical protein KBF98_05195 [Rhodoferax sp.]|jgi:signal transduction histidine kinase|nr:hypothetical protein [Rhodoferax sp.]MBP9059689.1 hypothetical protein [Rhodoferax sp.]